MKLSTQPYKGTRDFYPEDMRVRKWMFDKWRKVVESFGYEEYDGPTLELLDLYTAKTSEEIVNDQSFNFTDRGDRRVVMRPEMTPTVSRMVAARRQELGYPLRLYSIPNCFRYERQQRGRLREFWQLNADIFGIGGVEADIENILLADALMKEFGAKDNQYEIRINSREMLNIKINASGPKAEISEILSFLDKKDKMPEEEYAIGIDKYFNHPADMKEWLSSVAEGDMGLEIFEFKKKLENLGVSVVIDASVTRGFDYYTGYVFEVFDKNPENNRSLFGGGRYDGLVGEFGVDPVPTVGFGMGDVTFQNFLESNKLLPEQTSETDIYVIVIGDVLADAQKVAQDLRAKELNVAVDLSGKKPEKQIKNALKKGIPYLLFVGPSELKEEEYTLKDLQTGKEEKLTIDSLVSTVKNR